MKINKIVIALYVLGIIAGLVLLFMPVMLGGIESGILGFACVYGGMGIFIMCLALLETYISKRRRSGLLHMQQIEAKDERNIMIRDKAGAKTLSYLLFMLLISMVVFSWFDIGLDYVQFIWYILLMSCVLYFVHLYYYKQRL